MKGGRDKEVEMKEAEGDEVRVFLLDTYEAYSLAYFDRQLQILVFDSIPESAGSQRLALVDRWSSDRDSR